MLTIVAICIGASAGALARWQLGLWLNQGSALLPWAPWRPTGWVPGASAWR